MTAGLTPPLAGIGEDGRHLYTCPLCEAMCGLEIHVDGGRVASIRGNRDDTWSRGHICPMGATLGALHEDPDRIRRPIIKVDGQWHEVSWDAAFRRCTELLAPVIEKYGIGAVTCYTGNPLAHSFSARATPRRSLDGARRRRRCAPAGTGCVRVRGGHLTHRFSARAPPWADHDIGVPGSRRYPCPRSVTIVGT